MNTQIIKDRAEKMLSVIHLIERAKEKRAILSNSMYYTVFGNKTEKVRDVEWMDRVVARLENYLTSLK